MQILEATKDQNNELQQLQGRCPIGANLVVTSVNTPDFFARAKAYKKYKVFIACEENHIVGSAACAIRKGIVNGRLSLIGYEFQYFISPDHRRKGIAKKLHQRIENYLIQNGALLSYLLIMKDNRPSMRFFESQGFNLHRTIVMLGLAVYKKMDLPAKGKIRSITSEDLSMVAELLNETWQGFDLYEPASADSLAQFIDRMPSFDFDTFFVLEVQGEILACLGFWDWSQITRVTVNTLSLKMKIFRALFNILGTFRPLPLFVKPGDTLKQIVLTQFAFKYPEHLTMLLRYINNLALQRGIEQIFCACQKGHSLLKGIKGFIRVDTAVHLYIKSKQDKVFISDCPIFVDTVDL
jgi:GNAT superfamily N-acetyltransferase